MDPERLKGKNVLITGAGGGMGATNARNFAAQGANICVGDIDLDAAQATADAINAEGNGKAIAVRMDVTQALDRLEATTGDGLAAEVYRELWIYPALLAGIGCLWIGWRSTR